MVNTFFFFLEKFMSVCDKNHIGLWEKSCRFVGKIMSVCGTNHFGLWEKFVGLKKSLENSP